MALALQSKDYDLSSFKATRIEPFLLALANDLNTANALAELYNVTEEGSLLSSKNGFIPLSKVADDKNWKYKPLVARRPSSNDANRFLGLWKDHIGEKEKRPDMTWSLDFSIDNRPIIEYVCKDWHLGIIENGEVTDFSVAKRFHHILSNEHDYLIINSDIF